MINGIINVYKEAGFTSHDVVAKLRGIVKQKKIGHTGTLDPAATGVLPVCLGNATKLCDMLTDKSKEYEAVMLLGVETDTEDTTGTVTKVTDEDTLSKISKEQVKEAIMSFLGEYDQIPPMYSALKVNGKKLYELARAGETVERKARRVTIFNIEIVKIELPKVKFHVTCSKGTYIRSLCRDIGEKLGICACMENLVRRKVSCFEIEDALTLSQIEEYAKQGEIQKYVVSVEEMLGEYPKYQVSETQDVLLYNGNKLYVNQEKNMRGRYRVYDSKGKFLGLYETNEEGTEIKPFKMFL